METEISKKGAYTLIAPSGEIDFHVSPELREQLLAALNEGQHVVVDLSSVSYVDSSGIASLVEGLQHARGMKLTFGLAGVTNAVMQVLKLTRLDNVFTLYESVDDAIEE
jgi:anti-sigma B factor antagonist